MTGGHGVGVMNWEGIVQSVDALQVLLGGARGVAVVVLVHSHFQKATKIYSMYGVCVMLVPLGKEEKRPPVPSRPVIQEMTTQLRSRC